MSGHFVGTLLTPGIRAAQQRYYGESREEPPSEARLPLTAEDLAFLATRDSFYMSTVGETGWPYVQHRGGNPGFLRALTPSQLAFADYRGNRQLLSASSSPPATSPRTTASACSSWTTRSARG